MKGKTSTCNTALNKTNTKPVRNNQASNNYCNLQLPVYKSLNHRLNYCHFCLCNDIEKNPGRTHISPSKTIHAPYCQGNV